MRIHGHGNITCALCFVDGKRKLIAIDGRIDVIGRGKTYALRVDKEAMVAQMVVCIVNANVQKNSTKQLLTISQGIGTSRLEKVNKLKIARPLLLHPCAV